MRAKKFSFMIYHAVGKGWEIGIRDISELKAAERHLKRIKRRHMFGEIPAHQYNVCVETKFFGLIRRYTLV